MNNLDTSRRFMSEARQYLESQTNTPPTPNSAQEYFTLLLAKGLATRENGNYGIAAVLLIRNLGEEMRLFGVNELIKGKRPGPDKHAEIQTAQNAAELLQRSGRARDKYLREQQEKDMIQFKSAPHNKFETVLYTTLEPCPMCTVGAVINPGIQRVVIGIEDEYAGQLKDERLANLSPLWMDMKQSKGIQVDFAQSENPESIDTFVSPVLLGLLGNLFFQTKEPLDAHLQNSSFLDTRELGKIAAARKIR